MPFGVLNQCNYELWLIWHLTLSASYAYKILTSLESTSLLFTSNSHNQTTWLLILLSDWSQITENQILFQWKHIKGLLSRSQSFFLFKNIFFLLSRYLKMHADFLNYSSIQQIRFNIDVMPSTLSRCYCLSIGKGVYDRMKLFVVQSRKLRRNEGKWLIKGHHQEFVSRNVMGSSCWIHHCISPLSAYRLCLLSDGLLFL